MQEKLLFLLGEAASLENEFIMHVTYPPKEENTSKFIVMCYNGESYQVE